MKPGILESWDENLLSRSGSIRHRQQQVQQLQM